MPRLSILSIRASLVYLLVGFLFGALILAGRGVSHYPPVWNFFPVHIEFLLIGWLVQLAMGVGFWIFPRFGFGLPDSRGNETLIWASLVCLNVGIWLSALQLWISPAYPLGRLLELIAAILYVMGLWRRVKPHGIQAT